MNKNNYLPHAPTDAESSSLSDALERLAALAERLGERLPRVLVVIGAYRDFTRLEDILNRIQPAVFPLIAEIAIFDVFSEQEADEDFGKLTNHPARDKLRYFRIPRPYGYGENLKNSFDYAIEKGFHSVVILRGDGAYDPAALPAFLDAALIQDCPVVIGDRLSTDSLRGLWRRSPRLAANRVLSHVEEAMLGIGLNDYHCGFRLIKTDLLERIPYGLNAEDYLFDLHLLIQIRCLGVQICTVRLPPFFDRDMPAGQAAAYALRSVGAAVAYRLHQLHLLRNACYFVDLGETYTLKRNRHSSHMQILDSIEPWSKVLDLGCGRSLLAAEYAKKNVELVGVDVVPPDKVSRFVRHYVRHDLEQPVILPYGREFDSVVLADVIEHIVNRDAIMNSIRRFLKEDGKVIASTGNIAIWFYRLSLLLGRFEYGPRGILDRTHVHLFTLDSFQRFFLQRGYRILDVKFTPIPFELVFSSTGRSPLVEAMTRWYMYLTRLWPRMFAYQFIVHATFRSYESAAGEEMWSPDAGMQPEKELVEKLGQGKPSQ